MKFENETPEDYAKRMNIRNELMVKLESLKASQKRLAAGIAKGLPISKFYLEETKRVQQEIYDLIKKSNYPIS